MHRLESIRNRKIAFSGVIVFVGLVAFSPSPGLAEYDAEAVAAKVIGPTGTDVACSNCHVRETEAWKHTTHFSTFELRHRSSEAKAILDNMGLKSMKRSGVCLQCHYTSVMVGDQATPKWGVSCESCHSPGKDWIDVHNKVGGDPSGKTLKWGEGRKESAKERAARIGAAEAKGMITSGMPYAIARNCFGCHTVPQEELVNKGKHKAGTADFDLVAFSQGEVRHNYLSSPGAPDKPTNVEVSDVEKRRLYVIGAMTDLEFSLRNLASVKEKGGDFQKAMVDRVGKARKKLDAIFAAVKIPALSTAVNEVPAKVDETTAVKPDIAEKLRIATEGFSKDTPNLAAIDKLIPKAVKGTPFE